MVETAQCADPSRNPAGFAWLQDHRGGRWVENQRIGVVLVPGACLQEIDPIEALGAMVAQGDGQLGDLAVHHCQADAGEFNR